jgi:hypothetical protein
MARFIVQRRLGEVTDEELEAAARRSKQVREAQFPDVVWEHSHVVRTEDGFVTYCVYGGPDAGRIREHAAAAGIPADAVWELYADLDPSTL